MLLVSEEACLVNEDSDQPAFEGAFAAALGWVAGGGGAETVFDRGFGFLRAVEDAAGDEVKQLVIVGELQLELLPLDIGARLAVLFERAATEGNASVISAVRGGGEE